jgi:hypothetical protein
VKWTTKIPEKSGYFWRVEKYYMDGVLQQEYGPEVVYIEVDVSGSIIIESCGSDDSDFVNIDNEDFVDEYRAPRDPIFMFDDQKTKEEKAKDLVVHKNVSLISPIEMVEMPKEGDY